MQTVASLPVWDSRLSSKRQLTDEGIWQENQSAGKHHVPFLQPSSLVQAHSGSNLRF